MLVHLVFFKHKKEIMMNGAKEQFLKEITNEMHSHWEQYQQLNRLHWILIGVAGVLTAVAGSPQGQNQWFASSYALVAWGSITAIGTAINQFANPAKNSESHYRPKIALAAIRGAVEFWDLPLEEAQRLRILAWTNTEQALLQLEKYVGIRLFGILAAIIRY